MKKKRILLLFVLLVLIVTSIPVVPTYAKPKINKTEHTMIAGKTVKLKITGTTKTPTWSSSNKKIATVSKTGLVKARKAGTVTIKAKVGAKTLKCKIVVFAAKPKFRSSPTPHNGGSVSLVFHQDGWYVARLEVQIWDKQKEQFQWIYSNSRSKGQKATMTIDTNRYDISRVGYQVWFFGWDNFYLNLPWERTNRATDFTLSGYGDYPKFTWK